MRTRWCIALAMAAALAAPASAEAGGWATVTLSSTPDGLRPGETWVVDIEILQHGKTPAAGLRPALTVREGAGGVSRSVPVRPTRRPGTYRARVELPRPGIWEYVVQDGFGQTHTYPPVDIAAAPSAGGSDGGPDAALAGLSAALFAGGITAAVQRRRRRQS